MPYKDLDREQKLKVRRELFHQYYREEKKNILIRTKKYYADHADFFRRYRQENPPSKESIKVYKGRYKMKDPVRFKLKQIKQGAKQRGKSFSLNLYDFKPWFLAQSRICFYCRIPEEKIKLFGWKRHALTIDRKDNSKGYEISNICFSCDRCNTAKSSYIPYEAMVEIGKKYLLPQWKRFLGED